MTESERMTVRVVRTFAGREITAEDIKALLNVSPHKAGSILRQLAKHGAVKSSGERHNIRLWRVITMDALKKRYSAIAKQETAV